MTKKILIWTACLSSAIILTPAVAVPLVWNSQENTSTLFSEFVSTEPSIQLSNVASVDKKVTKGSSASSTNDYAQFKVDATILNKISNVDPVYSWFEKTSGVDVPLALSTAADSIYIPGPTPNILLVNVNNLSNANPSLTSITKQFYCRVTYNNTIVSNSNVATLNVTVTTTSINITQQPQSVTNAQSSQTLSVIASVSNPIDGQTLTYQWYQVSNGINTILPGETSSFLLVNLTNSELLVNTSKSYMCELKYSGLVSYTAIATVSTTPPNITIITQPNNTVVDTNKNASLSVSASTTSSVAGNTLSYQWYQVVNAQNVLVNGQTTNTLNLSYTDQQMNTSGVSYYFCRVIYGSIFVDSNSASVTINAPSINITTQPQGFTYSTSSSISVVANVTNQIAGQTLTYQWYENVNGVETLLTNQTNSSLAISYASIDLTASAQRNYFCKLSYNGVTINSATATITIVGSTIVINTQPQDISVATSSSTLSVVATVTNPASGISLAYQWYQVVNGVNTLLPGQTNSTMSLNYTTDQLNSPAVNSYFCRIIYGNASLDTNTVTVRITATDVIASVIAQFNAKTFSEKLSLYRALFNSTNAATINTEISNAPSTDLINQSIQNINMSIADQTSISNQMGSSPISTGTNGNILFSFNILDTSNASFSYYNTASSTTICDFPKIQTSQISDLNIIYSNSYFGVSVTLNSATINGLSYSVFGQTTRTFYYKTSVSYTGILSNTFNDLIKTTLLHL